jgi:hypothetical protein
LRQIHRRLTLPTFVAVIEKTNTTLKRLASLIKELPLLRMKKKNYEQTFLLRPLLAANVLRHFKITCFYEKDENNKQLQKSLLECFIFFFLFLCIGLKNIFQSC